MLQKPLSILTTVSAMALVCPAAANAQQTDQDAAGAEEATGNVIIVTANRRDEAISEVPSSVTAIGAEQLSTLNAARIDDFISQVPNINFTGRGPGERQLILRGISTSTNDQSATVATYIDDVVVGSSTSLALGARSRPDVNIFDLERIEVLRGPQGTLYGANSLGGLLKYVTKTPDTGAFEIQGRVEALTVDEGGTGYAINAAVNVPLSDTVAVRASAFTREEPGYIDDVGLGRTNVNDLTNSGGRIALQADVTPDFMLRAVALYQKFETGGQSVIDVNADGTPQFGPLEQFRFAPEPLEQETTIFALTAEYDFGFATLTSTTSYSDINESSTVDFTQFDAGFVNNRLCAVGQLPEQPLCPLPDGQFLTPEQRPFTVFPADRTARTEKITQELQLISQDSDVLEWRVGAYITREDSLFLDDELGFPVLGAPRSDARRAFLTNADSTYDEFSVFGEVTVYLTEQFDITGGLRYSDNSIDLERTAAGFLAPTPVTANFSSSDDATTFAITPRYRISDDVMVYFRAASGFRPGGPNIINQAAIDAGADAAFSADKLTNYEIGIKAATPDGVFSIDAAAFYIDWSDIQIRTSVNGFFFIGNAGQAESKGAEVAFTVRPTAGFSIALNAGYTDATLTEDAPGIGGLAGETLPNAPEWTFGGLANYVWSLSDTIDANIGASFRYVDDRFADFNRNGSPRLVMDGYPTFDLFAGVDFDNFGIDLFVRNVSNERGVDALITNFTPRTATITRPRTFGISLTAGY